MKSLIFIMLASLTLTLTSCESAADKQANKMIRAIENEDIFTALDYADMIYDDFQTCSIENITNIAFCYYIAAISEPSNKYVKTWLARSLNILKYANQKYPNTINEYLMDIADGTDVESLIEIINSLLEYIDEGGSLEDLDDFDND